MEGEEIGAPWLRVRVGEPETPAIAGTIGEGSKTCDVTPPDQIKMSRMKI
jgi:hypothetical protein